MAKHSETTDLLHAVIEAFEHSDPAAWRTLVTEALGSENSGGLWSDPAVTQNAAIAQFKEQYLLWKKHLAECTIPNGMAFRRSLWNDLADPNKRALAAGIRFPSGPVTPQMLLDALEGQPTLAIAQFAGSDLFASTCVNTLMGEVAARFQQRDLTESEKLNDAGFDHHHPGGYDQAIPLHEKAIELAPTFALAWVNKGIALKNLQRYDEAIECYEHVLQGIDPEYKKAWHNKAVALMMKGDLRPALECLDRAIQLDPTYEVAIGVRQKILRELQADAFQPEELTLDPRLAANPQAVRLIAMAAQFQDQRNWEAAARLWEQASALVPDHPDILVGLGNALYEAGRRDEAVKRFRDALAADPQNGTAWFNLARHYVDEKDFAKALEATSRAVQFAPRESMAWANHASTLFALRRYREGAQAAQRAVELDGHNDIGLYYLGVCLWEDGRIAEAQGALETLLRVRPDSATVASVRDILAYLDGAR